MNIGITLKPYSYTPEVYAYEKYLTKLGGWSVQLDYENNLDPNNDINIYFMGLRPFWKKSYGRALEVHEYQSLSTPPYAKIKDNLKKIINLKPSGRIFLNNTVFQNLNINDKVPFIYRDMGIDKEFFQMPKSNPEYDIIYSGSINRVGVPEIILQLAKRYRIIVVGGIDNILKEKLCHSNITLTGKVKRSELPELYANARFGLNYTPDIYPFNIQTSTKTLEYLASGLHIISNQYQWVSSFFQNLMYKPIWIESLFELDMNSQNLEKMSPLLVDMRSYEWSKLLERSKFDIFLNQLLCINE